MKLNSTHRAAFLDQISALYQRRETLKSAQDRANKEQTINPDVWDAELYLNGLAIEAAKQALINNDIDY